MQTKSLGIFIDNLDKHDQQQLSTVLDDLKKKYHAPDYIIFTDFFTVNHIYNWGLLSTFYMKFFQGKLIFLAEEDYNKHKDNTLAENILEIGV